MENELSIHGRFEGNTYIYLCQNNVCIFINEAKARNIIKELQHRVSK